MANTALYLLEVKRLFIVHRIDAIAGYNFRSVLFAHCVRRQTIHVHINVRAHLLIGQPLTRYDLQQQ